MEKPIITFFKKYKFLIYFRAYRKENNKYYL